MKEILRHFCRRECGMLICLILVLCAYIYGALYEKKQHDTRHEHARLVETKMNIGDLKKQFQEPEEKQDMDPGIEVYQLTNEEGMNRDLRLDIAGQDIPFFTPYEDNVLLKSHFSEKEYEQFYSSFYSYLQKKEMLQHVKVVNIHAVEEASQWHGFVWVRIEYDSVNFPVVDIVGNYDRFKGNLRSAFCVRWGD